MFAGTQKEAVIDFKVKQDPSVPFGDFDTYNFLLLIWDVSLEEKVIFAKPGPSDQGQEGPVGLGIEWKNIWTEWLMIF